MSATLTLGNVAPLEANGELAAIGNTTTDFEFPNDAQPDVVELLVENPRYSQRIRNTPESQRPWFVHLLDIEDAWWGTHSNDPPEWVEASDADLAALVADYFSTASHSCVVGRPSDW